MAKILLTAFGIFIILIALCGYDFSTRPFRFKIEHPYMAVGFVLIMIGAWFIYHEGTRK